MYTMTIQITEAGTAYAPAVLQFDEKRELVQTEKAIRQFVNMLGKLSEDEIATGKKPAISTKNDPQTMTAQVDIDKDGKDYGGYGARWPNQSVEARAYLRSELQGIIDGAPGRRVGSGAHKARP